ncbi:MAG: hypothetical protein ACRC7G_03475 [Beijerinckiaceae bacterium]
MTAAAVSAIQQLMGKLETLEKVVAELPENELLAFRGWFDEFMARKFDEELEQGILAGKFDVLAEEALSDLKAGRTRPL